MKDPFDRTKVVVRHLPPAISQSALLEQIDGRFSSRYKWFCFRPGKISLKHQQHSRAYIDFKKPEDVVEFAEFFDGHIFVNEKGAQFKAIVEYAPSQRVPKSWSKKDGREGTIFKDPEYLEFLELIAKPIENLPSAEIQLERREAERAGQQKETLVVTPLMDFVRQKRAAKSGPQRVSTSGKLGRRAGGASSSGNSSSISAKRGSEKRRISTSMYVLRDSPKNATGKEKSTYLLMSRREDKPVSTTGAEIAEDEIAPVTEGSPSKVFGTVDVGDKKVLLLKGKERETFPVSDGISQQSVSSPVRNSPGSTVLKQSQRREASGKIIRNILSKKEARPNQSATATGPSEQQSHPSNLDKEKHPLRPTSVRSILKDRTFISPISSTTDSDTKTALHDKVVGDDSCGFVSVSDKQDRRTRNKDRPDRGVWTSLRPLDRSHPNDKFLSSFSQPTQLMSDSSEGIALGGTLKTEAELDTDNNNNFTGGKSRNLEAGVHLSRLGRSINSMSAHDLGDMKAELLGASKSGEFKSLGSGRNNVSSVENGSHKHGGRRGSAHGLKEIDGPLNLSEGKPSKRGGGSGYGSHEKQVWVQKSGSGS